MHPPVEVVRLAEGRLPEAAALMTRAYGDDTFIHYLFPDPNTRLQRLSAFLTLICRESLDAEEAWTTLGDLTGVSLWSPAPPRHAAREQPETESFAAFVATWSNEEVAHFGAGIVTLPVQESVLDASGRALLR